MGFAYVFSFPVKNFFLLLLALSFNASAAVSAGAYVVSAGSGATFSASGISPAAVPYTFAASAANDGVAVSRAVPVSVVTPYGTVAANVASSGLLSKAGAAALGKLLWRALPVIGTGMAVYDAWQAYGITKKPDGTFSYQPSDGSQWCSVSQNMKCILPNATNPYCPSGYGLTSGAPASVTLNVLGGQYSCGISVAQYVPPAAVLPTDAIKDAAIDAYANNAASSNNATALTSAASAAKIPFPSISVVAVPPTVATSPWTYVQTSTDALGNTTTTSKQAEITYTPTAGAPMDAPIPVGIKENTKTTYNAAPSGTSSEVVNPAVSGASLPSNVSSSAAPASSSPTDCDKNPTSIGCSGFGDADVPDQPLGTRDVPISLGLNSVTEAASCPAPRSFSVMGRSFTLSYAPLCGFCSGVRPFVLLCFSLAAAFIFVGGVKNG